MTTTLVQEVKPLDIFPSDVMCKLELLERILRKHSVSLDSSVYWPISISIQDSHAKFEVNLANDNYIYATYDHQGVLNAWLYGSDRITVKDNIINETNFANLFRWLGIDANIIYRLTALHLNYEWLTNEISELVNESKDTLDNLGYSDWYDFVNSYDTMELYRELTVEQNSEIVVNYVNYMVQKLADPNLLWGMPDIQNVLRECSSKIREIVNDKSAVEN